MAVTLASDTCTNNSATLSPLWTDCTLSKGNLKAVATGNAYQWAISTIAIPTTGKWVFEAQSSNIDGSARYGYVGICQMGNHNVDSGTNYIFGMNLGNGEVVKNNGVQVDIGAGPTTSLMRIEYDADNDTIKIFDDNSEVFPASTGVTNVTGLGPTATGPQSLHFYVAPYASGTDFTVNFGASSFTNDPTSGFLGLNTTNLYTNSVPTIGDGSAYFQATTYTGDAAASNEINQSGNSTFQPDLVWIKNRSVTSSQQISDVIRGATKELVANSTGASYTNADGLLSFDSDGFTVGADAWYNGDGNSLVAWQWKAGASNTAVSASGSGDDAICACTHRANTDSGISIIKYTGRNGDISNSQHSLVTHGLGAAPKVVWGKNMDSTTDWFWMSTPQQNDAHMHLNTTATNVGSDFVGTFTDSTSTHFTVGNDDLVNKNGDEFMAYAFLEIPGFSKFGLYEGNNAVDGPYVHLGFKPAFLIVKNMDATGGWPMYDNARDPTNPADKNVNADQNGAEYSPDYEIDLLSNGFKLRDDQTYVNDSNTYFYMAFAEHPFAGSAPATAR